MAWVNGKSGTYNISTNNAPISGYVYWSERYDIANNKSEVSQIAYLHRTNIYSGATYFYSGTVTRIAFFDSEAVSTTVVTDMSIPGNTSSNGGEYVQVYSAVKEIPHNADGSKSITLGFSMSNNVSGVAGNSFTVPKTTATVSLTTIPRATKPTLSATSVTMGSTMRITLTPADSSFKHKIRYEFGSLVSQVEGMTSGVDFTSQGTTYHDFTPPVALANQIPSANSGTAKLIIYTYRSDGTHVGTETANITINVPSYTPQVGGVSVTGNNLLSGVYVQGKSTATVQITASSSYGASIKSILAVVDGKTYTGDKFTTDVLKTTGQKDIVVTVTDTRNKLYTYTYKSAALTVYAYSAPSITEFALARQSDGTTVKATVKGSIASVNSKNANVVTVSLPGSNEGTIDISSGYTINGTATFTGVPTDSTLTGTAKLQDSYTSATRTYVLPTVAVTMDFHHSGKGVAFGKVAELENTLDVAWNIKNDSIPTLLGGMGQAIAADSDINTLAFITPGNYVCSLNDVAKTLRNTPTSVAFKMRVSNCLDTWTNVQTGSYMYLIREITNYDGRSWIQYVRKEGGGWHFAPWRLLLDDGNCPDYVIEQGTYDGWEYTKWNSGKMELFGEKSLSFPEGAKQGDFPLYRSIVSLNLSSLLTKIMSGTCCIQTNGMVPQVCRHSSNLSMAEIVIVTSRTFSAFAITAPIYIIGKWK